MGLFSEAAELLLDVAMELDTHGDTEGEVGFGFDELGGMDGIGEPAQYFLMGRGELMLELSVEIQGFLAQYLIIWIGKVDQIGGGEVASEDAYFADIDLDG